MLKYILTFTFNEYILVAQQNFSTRHVDGTILGLHPCPTLKCVLRT